MTANESDRQHIVCRAHMCSELKQCHTFLSMWQAALFSSSNPNVNIELWNMESRWRRKPYFYLFFLFNTDQVWKKKTSLGAELVAPEQIYMSLLEAGSAYLWWRHGLMTMFTNILHAAQSRIIGLFKNGLKNDNI